MKQERQPRDLVPRTSFLFFRPFAGRIYHSFALVKTAKGWVLCKYICSSTATMERELQRDGRIAYRASFRFAEGVPVSKRMMKSAVAFVMKSCGQMNGENLVNFLYENTFRLKGE